MEKNPTVYLKHIINCIGKIKTYTDGMDQGHFLDHTMTQDAVIRNFEIIGEAVRKLDQKFRDKYPQVEWKKIAGMRDKLIHDYIGVDLWAVWSVVVDVLPEFEKNILNIIDQEESV